MATSTISNTVTDANGVAVADCPVTIRLIPRGAFRIDTNTEIAPVVHTTTDATGLWSVTLEENANITPANSYYEVEESIPTRRGAPRKYTFEVGASNASLLASLVSPIPDLPAQTYLTQEAADARYQLSPATFGGAGDITTVNPDDSASAGSLAAVARIDHQHAAPAAAPSGVTLDTAASEGSSSSFARADHVHPHPTAGLIVTGGDGTRNVTIGPVGTTDQGGRIRLKGGLNGASADFADWEIDVFTDQLRIHTGGVVYLQQDISLGETYIKGYIKATGNIYPNDQTVAGLGYVSTQAGDPFADEAPVLRGDTGWAFYHVTHGGYRMGFRGNSANTVRYLWCADFVQFGNTPDDGKNTHNLRVTGTVYISSTLEVAGASTLTGTVTCNQVNGTILIGSTNVQGTRQAGTQWNDANFIANPGANAVSYSFHPGGVAPQLRVGNSVGTIYVRNSADSAYDTLTGVLVNTSSRREKQDIEEWPPRSERANAVRGIVRSVDAASPLLDKVMRLKPAKFRRKKENYLLEVIQHEDGTYGHEPHDCAKHQCKGTDMTTDPCYRVKNWERGEVGLIAEEVYEVFPECVHMGPDGEPEGFDGVALAAICIAAIHELAGVPRA